MAEDKVGAEGIGASGEGEYKEPEKADENTEETVDLVKKANDSEEAADLENPAMETKDGSEAVEYDAGKPDDKSPMDEIAEEDNTAEPEEINVEPDEAGETLPQTLDDMVNKEMPPPEEKAPTSEDTAPAPEEPADKFTDNPVLTESNKPGFDPQAKQDARFDDSKEGGISRPQTTGPHKTDGDASKEGMQIKPKVASTDVKNQFEMSGFSVSYEAKKGQGLISLEIRDHFIDLETAQASVNGDRYLMPLEGSGFKVVKITTGAPKISFEEREIYIHLNDKGVWSRV